MRTRANLVRHRRDQTRASEKCDSSQPPQTVRWWQRSGIPCCQSIVNRDVNEGGDERSEPQRGRRLLQPINKGRAVSIDETSRTWTTSLTTRVLADRQGPCCRTTLCAWPWANANVIGGRRC